MTAASPYFRRQVKDGREVFCPLEGTRSGWNDQHMRGPAVTALLARAAEGCADRRPELRAARATFELFRPALRVPSTTTARVVREGRRLMLVDSELVQDGGVVARASTMFLAAGADPEGRLWSPDAAFSGPPVTQPTDDTGRAYYSGSGWTAEAADHRNSERKQVWQVALVPVDGEVPSPFQLAAAAADQTNFVAHWGDAGVEHINADVTFAMARLPQGGDIGLVAVDRLADSGISVGTALLYDRDGVFGSATVSALANAHRAVQPGRGVG